VQLEHELSRWVTRAEHEETQHRLDPTAVTDEVVLAALRPLVDARAPR
jgi:hypothetical protein